MYQNSDDDRRCPVHGKGLPPGATRQQANCSPQALTGTVWQPQRIYQTQIDEVRRERIVHGKRNKGR